MYHFFPLKLFPLYFVNVCKGPTECMLLYDKRRHEQCINAIMELLHVYVDEHTNI